MLKRIQIRKWGVKDYFYSRATSGVISGLLMSFALQEQRWSFPHHLMFLPQWTQLPGDITRNTRYMCTQNKKCVIRILSFQSNSLLISIFSVCEWVFFFVRCLRSNGLQALSSAVFQDMKTSLQMFCCTHKCIITELVRCLKDICEHFNLNSLSVCIITLNLYAYLAK